MMLLEGSKGDRHVSCIAPALGCEVGVSSHSPGQLSFALPCGGGTNCYLPWVCKGEVTRELVLTATCRSPLPCLGR